MKIEINEFRRVVTACERISSGKSAPVFRMIRLEANAGKMTAMASDSEYWLTLSVACDGDLAATLVPADKLMEAATKLTADTLDVTAGEGNVLIKAGRSRRTIQTEKADSFIMPPAVDAEPLTMDAERLVTGFDLCHPFAATDYTTKGYLCGVRVHSDGGNLYFAATDGNGVVEYRAGETDNDIAVTVPSGLASEVVKLGLSGEIGFAIGERKIKLDWQGGQLLAPVVEGNFVPYRKIVEAANGNASVTADADSVGQSVRGVSGFGTKDSALGSGIAFAIEGEHLTLTARSHTGEAVDSIPCETAGDVPRFGMSSAYMAKACKFFADGDMRFQVSDANSPVKLTSETHADRVAVIMPRRI